MITTRPASPSAKAAQTLIAEAALRGIAVTESIDHCGQPLYVAARGALCRRFPSLHALHQWLAGESEEAPA